MSKAECRHCSPYAGMVVLKPSNAIRTSISEYVVWELAEALGPMMTKEKSFKGRIAHRVVKNCGFILP